MHAGRSYFFYFVTFLFFTQALSIYHNRDLITVFHGDQEGQDDFDRIILRALVRGEIKSPALRIQHVYSIYLWVYVCMCVFSC